MNFYLWIASFSGLLITWQASGVDFEKEVKPVLEKKCLACHNPNIKKGGLSFDTRDKVLNPKDLLVVPGDAEKSDLWLVSIPDKPGKKPYMPEEGDPLTEAEAELLAKWINEGAAWPDGLILREASKTDKSWWAYQKLAEPKNNSIDAYIDARLSAAGLKRNPAASRRDLIRRASYDLTGLPPTPEEVAAFVEDQSPDAWKKLIDRLLASPRYGERWGRHWLDVVRFGESNGFERNFIINELWPFRDYVIRSINEDKPFDQLIREHIAGDVFGKDNSDIAIGSCFLVAGPYDDVRNQDPKAQAQIRANTLDEIINATGEAFLGMTLGCARCHDHKFDPISQKDYYQMYATFAGVKHGRTTLATADEKKARAEKIAPLQEQHDRLVAERTKIEKALQKRIDTNAEDYAKTWTRPKIERTGTIEDFKTPIEAKWIRFTSDANDRRPESKSFRLDEFEVYSEGKNVALASNGGKASGPARVNEDFPGVYGAHLTIDGKSGARYLPTSNYLLIELPKTYPVERIIFSSAKGESLPTHSKFSTVAEYRIEISTDGDTWQEIASGRDRQPVNKAHRDWRIAKQEITESEAKEKQRLTTEINRLAKEIKDIPDFQQIWMGTRDANLAEGPFHLLIGGNPQRKGDTVTPASLSTLSEVLEGYELPEPSNESERRLKLAEWITNPGNPLTARVLANRLWHYHFGTGIVNTPNDFGYMGDRPSHPELLDFLAVQLKENGWQLKAMHRLIMLSETYQQSSDHRDNAAQIDRDSRLLWRFPPRRLSAEEIRDTILSISGKLDLEPGGPGFRLYKYMSDNVSTYEPLDTHGPETYRRAVYHQNARASVVDLMTEFDQPDCALSAPKRARTTTPLQALTMLNHQFTFDMAEALAERVGDIGKQAQISKLYALAYLREPTEDEFERVGKVLDEHGLRAVCRAVLNSSELIYLD